MSFRFVVCRALLLRLAAASLLIPSGSVLAEQFSYTTPREDQLGWCHTWVCTCETNVCEKWLDGTNCPGHPSSACGSCTLGSSCTDPISGCDGICSANQFVADGDAGTFGGSVLPNSCVATCSYAPPPPKTKNGAVCRVGGPRAKGDPFSLENGTGTFVSSESTIETALGPLHFEKFYVTSPVRIPSQPFVPTPFGTSPLIANGMQWWHSLYSYVSPLSGNRWAVFYPTGDVANFSRCDAGTSGCFAPVAADSREVTDKLLYLVTDAGSSFTLYRNDRRFVYSSRWDSGDGGTSHFLTRIEPGNYSTTSAIATLTYATPDAGGCPGGSNGVPYIDTVVTAEGTRLDFRYVKLSSPPDSKFDGGECVLSSIYRDGGLELVHYTYANSTAGLLASAQYPQRPVLGGSGRTENYAYDGGFVVSEGASTLLFLSMSSGVVQHQYAMSDGTNLNDLWSRDPLDAGLSCTSGNPDCAQVLEVGVRQPGVLSGEGESNSASSASLRYSRMESSLHFAGTRNSKEYQGSASTEWKWDGSDAGLLFNTGVKDENGHYTTRTVATPAGLPATFTTPYEVTSLSRGASNFSGSGALEVTNFTYAYSDAGSPSPYTQLLKTESRSSVLDGGSALTTYNYEAGSDRLVSVIRSGTTRYYASRFNWPTTTKHIGTFYRSNSDPLGRVTEVHGPCFVPDSGATECGSGSAPFTTYEYYALGASGHNSGRLYRVTRYPNSTSNGSTITAGSGGLATVYAAYDVWGNPTQVTDPNSVVTTYTYQESRVTSREVDGATWSYGYDGDKLTYTRSPSGVYEVFCYRASSVGNCSSSDAPTTSLAWKAVASSSSGSGYTEAIRYTYGSDGRLQLEEVLYSDGGVARATWHEADPFGNPSFDYASGFSHQTSRLFDGVGNLTGLSMPFQRAAPLCGASGPGVPPDARCALLGYDSADRLVSLDEAGLASGGAREPRTQFRYDSHGNISAIKQGCDGGASWGDCTVKQATYETDDFGNSISYAIPNSFGLQGDGGVVNTTDPSPSYVEYNAMGLPVRKQTIGMNQYGADSYERSLVWTYDSMGRRLLFQSVYTDGGVETLSTNVWDSSALPTGCDTIFDSYFTYFLSGKAGRLAATTDPIYATYFGYDREGRLTEELKVNKTGAPQCTEWMKDFVVTEYRYNSNGDLILDSRPPTGRAVAYNYGAGALGRRISSIDVDVFDGWSFNPTRMIANVQWEPYGGLRRYTMVGPFSGGVSGTVEYVPGTESGSPSCSSSPALNDGSGRLGAIVVTADGGTNLMKRFYTWSDDQIERINTCYLDAGAPIAESFGYDTRGQLTEAAQANFASAGGAYSLRQYTYDKRGNRRSVVVDDGGVMPYQYYYGYPAAPDQLYSFQDPTLEYVVYEYTSDGQMARKFGPYDSSGQWNTVWLFDWGESTSIYGTPVGFGAESVYHAMGFGNPYGYLTYTSYYYDANRRRIAKDPATGGREFYHWNPSRELLTDLGRVETCDSMDADCMTSDEYVWLDGRPVIQLRGTMEDMTGYEQYSPHVDGTGICIRDGEWSSCDAYFIVTDQVARPVLMLNHAMQISGTGEYDPFGAINRVHMFRESPHPYTTSTDYVFSNVGRPSVGGLKVDVRAHLPLLDLANNGSFVALENADGGYLIGSQSMSGLQNLDLWTPWATQEGGQPAQLRFHAVDPTASWPTPTGFAMSEYEFRRYQTTYPLFTPLRGAGQYWDQETDMFENHNRYYEAATGRYLSPEPLLQSPNWVREQARDGYSAPTYAYARNNPVRYTDPNGLQTMDTYSNCVRNATAAGLDPKQICGDGPDNIPNPDWDRCNRLRIECKNACNSGCDPESYFSRAKLLICYSVCDMALAACMAKAPLRH